MIEKFPADLISIMQVTASQLREICLSLKNFLKAGFFALSGYSMVSKI